jgi:hypothetical protein
MAMVTLRSVAMSTSFIGVARRACQAAVARDLRCGAAHDVYLDSVPEPRLADDHDVLVAAQAVQDLDLGAPRIAGADRPALGLAIDDDKHGFRGVVIDDRDPRHQQHVLPAVPDDIETAEHAGLEPPALVGHFHGDLEGAGGGIDDRADALHLRLEALPRNGIQAQLGGLPRLQPPELALRDMDISDQGIQLGHLEGGLIDRDGVAEPDVPLRDHAGDRRAYVRVAVFQLGEAIYGAQGLELVLQVLEGAGTHQATLEKLHAAVVLLLALAEVGELALHLEAETVAVEPREHLAFLDTIAFFHEDLDHLAADLGDDQGVGIRLQRGGPGVHGEHVAAVEGSDLNGDRGAGLVVLAIGRGGAAVALAADEQSGRQDERRPGERVLDERGQAGQWAVSSRSSVPVPNVH